MSCLAMSKADAAGCSAQNRRYETKLECIPRSKERPRDSSPLLATCTYRYPSNSGTSHLTAAPNSGQPRVRSGGAVPCDERSVTYIERGERENSRTALRRGSPGKLESGKIHGMVTGGGKSGSQSKSRKSIHGFSSPLSVLECMGSSEGPAHVRAGALDGTP
jgi:hypothetical protein